MNSIKQSKIKLVLHQFEEQLKVDSEQELRKQREQLDRECEKKVGDITKQKGDYLDRVDDLKVSEYS